MNSDELKALCNSWPGVSSRIKGEDELEFSVKGKLFAVLCLRGPDRDRLSFKVDPGRFVEMSERPGMVPAHYSARAFWVTMVEPERFSVEEARACIRRSYELVCAGLGKKQQDSLGNAQASRIDEPGKPN
ncbi:MAG: MmcQ/YjbR family DNA-binding protein [Rudaea sp.]